MGNSASGEYRVDSSADEIDLPSDFGRYDDDGRLFTRKARKALNGIRKMLEKTQPLEAWYGQLVRINDHIEDKRIESLRHPDVQHATRLQRKLRSSPRSTCAKRSVSAPERLGSLSRRVYYDKLDLQYSRTQSVLEIELASWFGSNVDDLAHRVYLKYLAIDPIVDDILYPDDEEYEEIFDDHDSCCDCNIDQNNNLKKPDGNLETAKEKFIEDTVSHVLEFKKLIEDKAMSSKKRGERNAHAAKINDSVKNFIQLTTEHVMGRFDVDKKRGDKVSYSQEEVPSKQRLQEMKEKILPYSGRESNKSFFNEVYNDFMKQSDQCQCKFTKDGRGIKNASLVELGIHAHHHLQAVEQVKELFIQLLRESPDELKGCPIEMQIMYQSMARNLALKESAGEKTDKSPNKKVEPVKKEERKTPKSSDFEHMATTFESPYIDIDEKTFKQFPIEMQKAMEKMIGNKQVGKFVIRQSITLNKQALHKKNKK